MKVLTLNKTLRLRLSVVQNSVVTAYVDYSIFVDSQNRRFDLGIDAIKLPHFE